MGRSIRHTPNSSPPQVSHRHNSRTANECSKVKTQQPHSFVQLPTPDQPGYCRSELPRRDEHTQPQKLEGVDTTACWLNTAAETRRCRTNTVAAVDCHSRDTLWPLWIATAMPPKPNRSVEITRNGGARAPQCPHTPTPHTAHSKSPESGQGTRKRARNGNESGHGALEARTTAGKGNLSTEPRGVHRCTPEKGRRSFA